MDIRILDMTSQTGYKDDPTETGVTAGCKQDIELEY
jgi:hypothetical protein